MIEIKHVFVEEDTLGSYITKNIFRNFDNKNITTGDFKEKDISISDGKTILLVKNYIGDFIKSCPCTKNSRGCGYVILNQMVNCPYDCSYCYLQLYLNNPYLYVYANTDEMLDELADYLKKKKRIRIGTGEFTDSLALDNITEFSKLVIPFFSKYPENILELKTKSVNVDNLLTIEHVGNTVISWSLNPDTIINSEEEGTPLLEERLEAAKKCQDSGYLIGFHFDPIIYSENWEKLYKPVVYKIFDYINPGKIFCISLGTFRYVKPLKNIIIERFPESRIVFEEQLTGIDGKSRYFVDLRIDIYKKMLSWLRDAGGDVFVYLCMESKKVWSRVFKTFPSSDGKLNRMFFRKDYT